MPLSLLLVLVLGRAAAPPAVVTRQAYVMGTKVTLSARGESHDGAVATTETLLATLEETENALSTWRDTPFNRLNALAERSLVMLAPDLCHLFIELDRWTSRTGGAFDPAVGPLLDLWGIQSHPRVPRAREIRAALPRSQLSAWRLDVGACTIARPPGGRLDSGAFGKGEALDRAIARKPDTEWLIDLGGQVSVNGTDRSEAWRVGIAHPRWREQVLLDVQLRSGSLSTSGGSERDQRVAGTRVGHILDPRTGMPAAFGGAVVVWDARGLVADILSTALYVMGPGLGFQWAQDNRIAACFLVPDGPRVRVRPTSAFTRKFGIQARE